MHIFMKIALGTVGAALAMLGCSGASDDTAQTVPSDQTETTTQALGQRCTVSGNPAVTTGCTNGESCTLVACTNSVPPTCWGTCRGPSFPKPVSPPGCTGAFNCLCGTPACVDGEWTCIGSCGPGGATE